MKIRILAVLLAFIGCSLFSFTRAQTDINLTGYTKTFDDEFTTLSVTTANPKGSTTWYDWPPYGAAGGYSSSTWDINAFSVSSGYLTDTAWISTTNKTSGAHCYGPLGLENGSTAYVTGETLGALQSTAYVGWVGTKFTTGSSTVTVTSLGRWVASGNTLTHQLRLVDATTGADVPNGTTTVSTSGKTAGAFSYASLPATVTLLASHSYYLLSWESYGQNSGGTWVGDQWYTDATTLTTTTALTINTSTAGYWHSGNLSSMDPSATGFAQQYGYFEVYAKMPASGTGAWTAFWLMSANSIYDNLNGTSLADEEIDIFEWYGNNFTNNTSLIQEASHDWTPYNTNTLYSPGTQMPAGAYPWQGYHVYGCQVDPVHVTWYIDGVQTNQIATPTANITTPFYMMIDYALGGGWPLDGMVNNPYGTAFNTADSFDVAWCRVYALPAAAPAIIEQPASETVIQGHAPGTLNVVTSGSPAPTYQWELNGTAISGATSASYTPPLTATTGSVYSVVATNSGGSVTSANATLTVTSLSDASAVVVDVSGGTGITESGTWTQRTSPTGYYGSYFLSATTSGTNTLTFTPSLATTGNYEVFAWWPSNTTYATNASMTVNYAGGSDALTVNQRKNGGQWVPLGTYSFNSGTTGTVVVSNAGANASVIANAVCFVPVATEIVDVSDSAGTSGTTSQTGSWAEGTLSGYYGSYYLYATPGNNTLTFTPTLPATGSYAVYAWWVASSNRATNTSITVNDAVGAWPLSINQQTNGGDWESLGTHPFVSGTTGTVVISAAGINGDAIADAVEFVQQW